MTNILFSEEADVSLPEYPELLDRTYSDDDKLAIMPIASTTNREIEELILRSFAHAVVTRSSDVNISLKGSQDAPTVIINIRGTDKFTNFEYQGRGNTKHFATKMFALTNSPQGGSTAVTVSARFGMEFPVSWAHKYGLKPFKDAKKYYVNFRVEYTKNYDGASFVCRLIDIQRAPKLNELGLSRSVTSTVHQAIYQPSGLILLVGPTGCGKTTLLNAMATELNDGQKAISTIEDPVEYRLFGRGQIIQMEVTGDMTFARGLKSHMRQHPDIIIVGELRDTETAQLAMQAALTGHLVLATLHANSAAEAPNKFISMFKKDERDWAAATLATTLKLVMSPRLLKRSDGEIKPRQLSNYERRWFKENGLAIPDTFAESTSTEHKGKFGVLEAVKIDYELMRLIGDRATDEEIYRSAAKQLQYESLTMAGVRAVEAGHCHLGACRIELPNNMVAGKVPALRSELAKKFGMTYAQINAVIDDYIDAQHNDIDIEEDLDIEQIILKMKQDKEQRAFIDVKELDKCSV